MRALRMVLDIINGMGGEKDNCSFRATLRRRDRAIQHPAIDVLGKTWSTDG